MWRTTTSGPDKSILSGWDGWCWRIMICRLMCSAGNAYRRSDFAVPSAIAPPDRAMVWFPAAFRSILSIEATRRRNYLRLRSRNLGRRRLSEGLLWATCVVQNDRFCYPRSHSRLGSTPKNPNGTAEWLGMPGHYKAIWSHKRFFTVSKLPQCATGLLLSPINMAALQSCATAVAHFPSASS